LAFPPDKEDQHDGGDQHVHDEESADTIGEELLDEEFHVQAVLEEPGKELRVGKHKAENTKEQINVFSIHWKFPHYSGARFSSRESAEGCWK
jgi:hypothetical protein